ncbi:hypothetical protein WP3W18E01_38990 [Raoultella ornithinolytica]|jgi:hypothetical protein|uniref:YnaM/YnfT family protein n=1 Tax=Raoultella planticola TaxID=575 RepID=A0A2X2G4L1_RAOPL|nr:MULTISPECIES: YnaM/YnfT family protein [Raoultella]EHT12315.1 hypothetical protein HMPREF9690_01061 [Raoultella ornithinolytica 10-5246]KDV95240.1 putative membrane protein [Raoultella ornithinolytica 2-156-04_S1_C1]KDX16078.1 putative membrane protein [Raoultella ornithinolytica 2-156-04_S1_C2]KFD02240.1 hypothetical protein GRPL_04853 [Raoultella planticola ATCC 33531]ALQ48048.1 hypothetical protein ATN83_3939 [Raoultella ornithinolytica]
MFMTLFIYLGIIGSVAALALFSLSLLWIAVSNNPDNTDI